MLTPAKPTNGTNFEQMVRWGVSRERMRLARKQRSNIHSRAISALLGTLLLKYIRRNSFADLGGPLHLYKYICQNLFPCKFGRSTAKILNIPIGSDLWCRSVKYRNICCKHLLESNTPIFTIQGER